MTPALNANHNPGVSLTSVVKQTSATAHEVRPRVRACLFILRATGFNLSRTSNHNHTDHPHCNGDAEYGQAPFVKEHLLGRRITAKSEREVLFEPMPLPLGIDCIGTKQHRNNCCPRFFSFNSFEPAHCRGFRVYICTIGLPKSDH